MQTQSQSQGAPTTPAGGLLAGYARPEGYFCEMLRPGAPEDAGIATLLRRLAALPAEAMRARARRAERELMDRGITFTVYSEATAIDRILPLDLIPRIITAPEWDVVERGVKQRVAAINAFLHDVYHDAKCVTDGVIPRERVFGNPAFRPEMQGWRVPLGTYSHVCGTDIVRDEAGRFLVLEDNARTPSGVSYVIENRHMTLRLLSDLARGLGLRPVDEYGLRLHKVLTEIAPQHVAEPQVVLLSPGIYNSAYFEHVFLAREMGVPLVEGRDLVVEDARVFMRTTAGPKPVHSIYRRIDDDFLDPEVFRPDSCLGVPGLFEAWRRGNVGLANAVGAGVADDKAVYAYMPRLIRYYLGEDAILSNVETHICAEQDGLDYTLANLEQLVVKPVAESGGYGILLGPKSSKAEIEAFRAKLVANPSNYISQPLVRLSVSPTLVEEGVEGRHVDLRPFAVTGRSTWVLPGGLTRVALRRGGFVVNSSQGGGGKDTWVLE